MKIKNKLKIIWLKIKWPYDWLILEIKYRRKLKKLKETDPYIYD